MTQSASPLLGRLLCMCLLLACGFIPPAWAQRRAALLAEKPAGVTFTAVSGARRVSIPPIGTSGIAKLPALIHSQEYSLDYARHALVPAMGGSIAVGDFDGDGRPDIYVVVPGGSNHLFRGEPEGSFGDITEKSRVKGSGADLGAAFGDFDKSGHASLFVAGLGGVTLYHNNGDGTFTDTTAKSGLKGKPGELATSVLLFDADHDGFLDVLVTTYTDLSAPPAKASFTFPNDFAGANSRLYRNNHDGTFSEITEQAGLTSNPGRTHAALVADFDRTGRADLLLLRDDKPPALFRNQGTGEFEDKTWDAGSEIWKYAYVAGQAVDFNHDGRIDLALWSTIGNEAILNQGNGKFKQDDSFPLVYAANRAFGFHGLAADLNGDGTVDLLTVDDKGGWHFLANHFLVNHAGHFEEAPFGLMPEQFSGGTFASLEAFHLGKAGEVGDADVSLVGLTMDGRVEIFEREPNRDVHGLSGTGRRK